MNSQTLLSGYDPVAVGRVHQPTLNDEASNVKELKTLRAKLVSLISIVPYPTQVLSFMSSCCR
jgi:hypothetical protein